MNRILMALLVGSAAVGQTWTPPRTPDGQPALEGTWSNATLTLFERPRELGSKEFFTEPEAAAFEKQRMAQTNADRPEARTPGNVGSYNQFWFDRGTRVVESRRTSQIIDPPDGRVPALTPAAQKRFDNAKAEDLRHPSDGPENRLLTERCLLFGAAGPPMLVEPYNNNYQIVQGPGYVAILTEMIHDARIIPLDGRPHLPSNIPQWIGNSRGRWEGSMLVVDTVNFRFNDKSRFGVAYLDGMTDENLRVTERFTRTGPETIRYQATITDPTVYTRPWTVELTLNKRSEPLYEYACHEGNYGMFGILEGARAEEKKASAR